MKKLSVFKIYKKEIVWKTDTEEECEFVDLGAVKTELEANKIVDIMNKKNQKIENSYFYKEIDLVLYKNAEEFLNKNYNINMTLE